MWFEDDEMPSGRSKGRELYLRPILKANARLLDKKKLSSAQMAAFVLVPTLLVAAVLTWVSLTFVGRTLFSNNDRFRITNLEIREGTVITEDLIREYTRIQEGMNLFAFSISTIRRDLLRSAPIIKSVEITRFLPDTLKIEVAERVPVARIGPRGLVVDAEGCVFGSRVGVSTLPAIVAPRDHGLRPGGTVDGMTVAAIQVVEAASAPELALPVISVDASQAEYLVVHLANNKFGRLAWPRMGSAEAPVREALVQKLRDWSQVLQTSSARDLMEFDLTFEGRIYSR